MDFEQEQKHNDDVEGQTQHLRIGGHPVLTEGRAEVLLHACNEHETVVENRACSLYDGQQDFQREDLGSVKER